MKLKELKDLVSEYHLCGLKIKNSNIDAIVSKFRQVEILKTIETYSTYFLTTAKTFEENLKQNTKQNITLQTQIKSIKFDDENYSFAYHIKPTIQIKSNNETRNCKLPEFIIVSKNQLEDKDFRNNNFEISLLPFLLQTEPKTNKLIHLTCWSIVANNLFNDLTIN